LEKLAQLYVLRGKPYSAASSRLKALQFGPSVQQEVRLVLTVLPQLLEQKRHEEALGALQKLMRDQPDHPDRLALLKAALPIAEFLGQSSLVAQWTNEIGRLEPQPAPPKPGSNGTAASRN
jgi:tetratricopeptide (TPR) repeat protein